MKQTVVLITPQKATRYLIKHFVNLQFYYLRWENGALSFSKGKKNIFNFNI